MSYDGYSKYGLGEASEYDAVRESEPLWHAENGFVERFFSTRRVTRVLDAPVGTGRFLPYYRHVGQVVGIDVSPDMLAQSRRRIEASGLRGIELAQGDIFHLGYPDRHFDVTVSWRFLHLLPRHLLVPALSELARVTAGELLVQLYEAPPLAEEALATLKRAGRRLAALVRGPVPVAEKKPWSHIKAYCHGRRVVDRAVRHAGLGLIAREPLGDPKERVFALVLRPA